MFSREKKFMNGANTNYMQTPFLDSVGESIESNVSIYPF